MTISGEPCPEALHEKVQRDHAPFFSMAISCESGLEVGELPGDGKKDAASMATSSEPGQVALSEKAQGTMVGGSPIGDDVSG
jgi:hypothetical protein